MTVELNEMPLSGLAKGFSIFGLSHMASGMFLVGLFATVFVVVLLMLLWMDAGMRSDRPRIRAPLFPVKGYKGFSNDNADTGGPVSLRCLDMHYEVGRTYDMEEDPDVCERGFHFCRRLSDVFGYYPPNHYNVYGEVEATGRMSVLGNKWCTNRIRIVRLLSREEVRSILVREDPASPWLEDFLPPGVLRLRSAAASEDNAPRRPCGKKIRKKKAKKAYRRH